jgi:hypothetical protein
MTVLEIIVAALQELGVLVTGGTPNIYDTAWALGKFNRLLNTLSLDGLNLHYRIEESFNAESSVPYYTIGPGGTFDTARPNVIDKAFIRDNDHDYPVWIRPIDEYWDIMDKTVEDRPIKLYYDPTYPLGIIYLYFTPNSAYSLHIVTQRPLTTYASTLTEVSLPGGYEEALILKLALAMASRYGIKTSGELQMNAKLAYDSLRARHLADQMKGVDLNLPGAHRSNYNVDADY